MIKTRTEQLPAVCAACRKAGIVCNIIGKTGVGKSEIAGQFLEQVKASVNGQKGDGSFGVIQNILSIKDSVEERGIPFPQDDGTVEYYMNRDTPFQGNPHCPEFGARFNDEIDRASLAMHQAFIPQLTSRKVGNVPLKEGWWDICAMNGRSVDETVNDLPNALKTRMCHIYFHPSYSGLLKYAEKEGWHEFIVKTLRDNGPKMMASPPQFEEMAVPMLNDGTFDMPSNRQYEFASRLMVVCDSNPLFNGVRLALLQGVLGMETATLLAVKFASKGRVPTCQEIERNSPPVPEKSDEMYLGMVFPLFGTSVGPSARKGIGYLRRCFESGINEDLIRVGVNALASKHPEVWSDEFALTYA